MSTRALPTLTAAETTTTTMRTAMERPLALTEWKLI